MLNGKRAYAQGVRVDGRVVIAPETPNKWCLTPFVLLTPGLLKRVCMPNLTPGLLQMYQHKTRPLCVSLAFASCLIRHFSLACLIAVLIFFPKVVFAADIAAPTSSFYTVQGTTAYSSSAEAQIQINTLIAAVIAAYPGATQSGNTVQWEEGGYDDKRRVSRTWTVRVGSTQITLIRASVTSINPDHRAPVPGTRIYDSDVSQEDVLNKVVANAIAFYQGVGGYSGSTWDTPHRGYGSISALAYLEYYNGIRTCQGSTRDCGVPIDMISVTTTITPYYIDYQNTVSYCPAGYTLSGSTCSLPPDTPDPQKNNDEPDCGVGNPCNAGTGNKYQPEVDYAENGISPLKLVRVYNSGSTTPSSVETSVWGSRWRGVYDRSIAYATNGTISTATAKREGGKQYYFNLSGTSFVGDADVVGKLVRLGVDASGNATGWTYTNERDEVERYVASGKLVSITNRAGHVQTLTYSDGTTGANGGYVLDATGAATVTVLPAGRLIRVTDPASRSLQYGYDVAGRVVKATDPAGGVYTYAYSDATNTANLTSITYPDGKTRTYLYGEAGNVSSTPNAGVSYANSLTGIVDENGVRYASWTYDATGRATSSEHGAFGSGIDYVGLDYGTPDANGNSTTTVVDAQGTSRVFGFSATLGVVKNTSITGLPCNGCAAATTHDANGNVTSRADFNGNKTCYAYDLARNLETARVEGLASATACPTTLATYTPAAGTAQRRILTNWHATFRLPIKIAEAGRETTTVYDTRGNVTSTTIKDTATAKTRTWSTSYTYHATVPGVLVQKIDNGPRIDVSDLTTTGYYAPDENCLGGHFGCRGQVRQITNALGHVTRVTRYNAHGQPEEIIDPNGLVTTLAYDARQRLTSRVVGTETSIFEYDGLGQLTRLIRADGSTLNYSYDAAHRLTQIGDMLGSKIVYTLDAKGNHIGEDIVDPAGALIQTRRSEYDALSRLAKDIGAASQTTQYTYDAVGNPTGTTNPLGHRQTQTYDALNRLAQRVDATGAITRISRDARDNLTAVTNPRAHATQYTYDGLDNLTREISPDRGTINTTYDDAGNPLIVTDARGAKHTTTYDALNRPTQRSYTTGTGVTATPTITWIYDQGVNGIGRLTRMNDATGNTVYSYNVQGRRLSTTQTTTFSGASLVHTRSRTYDSAGRPSNQTYPSGLQISYGYDAQGRITSINLNGQPLLSNIAYRSFGAPKAWLWGNGQAYARNFDPDGRLSAYPIGSDTRVLSYDLASRIIAFGQTNPVYNRSFSYDPEDRLLTYQDNLGRQTYSYDTTGNRTGINYGSTAYPYTVAATSNRLTKVAGPVIKTYLYDAAGNPTSDGIITYTWDAANRLNKIASGKGGSAVSASYVYNGLGQRLLKTANLLTNAPWRYVYDEAGHLIGEYDKNNAVLQETVWLGDTPVAVVKQTAPSTQTIYFVQADHLNTPRVILNSANTPVWRWDNSDAFGVGQPDEDPDKDAVKFEYNPRFPGQYFDKETNLHYNGFRDYEPRTGRYVEADPIGLAGGANLYAYVRGNPISRIDPLGLSDVTFDRSAGTITVYDNLGNQVGQYPAGNNTTSTSNGAWPDGTYDSSHYVPHPESGATGPYGSNGNFVFDVPGRTGMGIHSGRRGPQSKTLGCIRTTDDATDFLKGLNKTDPLKTITVK